MTDAEPEHSARLSAEDRDDLPDDLQPDIAGGEYEFPDNSRRRIQGGIYLAVALLTGLVYALDRANPIVNEGWLVVAIALAMFGVYAIAAGWRMKIDEKRALISAQHAVGYAVGYASAQQVWRGWRSRPTWRVLCYSSEDPPTRRGLVLVDAVDGSAIEQLVQPADPDEWKS